MKSTIALVLAALAVLAIPAVLAQVNAQTTTTTTTTHHHFLFRHGFANPFGFGVGNNVVVIPAQTLSNSVINQCPAVAPILLSTGQCITLAQAQYEEQTGQLSLNGQVQAFGSQVIGTPIVIGGGEFFHHHHH